MIQTKHPNEAAEAGMILFLAIILGSIITLAVISRSGVVMHTETESPILVVGIFPYNSGYGATTEYYVEYNFDGKVEVQNVRTLEAGYDFVEWLETLGKVVWLHKAEE